MSSSINRITTVHFKSTSPIHCWMSSSLFTTRTILISDISLRFQLSFKKEFSPLTVSTSISQLQSLSSWSNVKQFDRHLCHVLRSSTQCVLSIPRSGVYFVLLFDRFLLSQRFASLISTLCQFFTLGCLNYLSWSTQGLYSPWISEFYCFLHQRGSHLSVEMKLKLYLEKQCNNGHLCHVAIMILIILSWMDGCLMTDISAMSSSWFSSLFRLEILYLANSSQLSGPYLFITFDCIHYQCGWWHRKFSRSLLFVKSKEGAINTNICSIWTLTKFVQFALAVSQDKYYFG